MSYVLTSSADFHQTLKQVVKGLESAGFTEKDYRAPEPSAEDPTEPPVPQIPITEEQENPENPGNPENPENRVETDIPEVDVESLKERVQASAEEAKKAVEGGTLVRDPLLGPALEQDKAMQEEVKKAGNGVSVPAEVKKRMKNYPMRDIFREEASALRIPQFMLNIPLPQSAQKSPFSMFSEPYCLLRTCRKIIEYSVDLW